jgi:hypothetical protein
MFAFWLSVSVICFASFFTVSNLITRSLHCLHNLELYKVLLVCFLIQF